VEVRRKSESRSKRGMSKSKGSKSEDTNREEYEANEEASECTVVGIPYVCR
jgi:hypothetical protein